jgi:hypothetical protein
MPEINTGYIIISAEVLAGILNKHIKDQPCCEHRDEVERLKREVEWLKLKCEGRRKELLRAHADPQGRWASLDERLTAIERQYHQEERLRCEVEGRSRSACEEWSLKQYFRDRKQGRSRAMGESIEQRLIDTERRLTAIEEQYHMEKKVWHEAGEMIREISAINSELKRRAAEGTLGTRTNKEKPDDPDPKT